MRALIIGTLALTAAFAGCTMTQNLRGGASLEHTSTERMERQQTIAPVQSGATVSVTMSPDGTRTATASSGGLTISDVTSASSGWSYGLNGGITTK
jgi:hypothetical protein